MPDRIFGALALLVALAYGILAFTVIEAPFQYDPLGPESWPRILSIVAVACCLYLLVRPDALDFDLAAPTGRRLLVVLALLVGYAASFEPLGFLLATFGFCTLFALLLGGTRRAALAFGAATGLLGYGVGAWLLDLNLPAGLLAPLL